MISTIANEDNFDKPLKTGALLYSNIIVRNVQSNQVPSSIRASSRHPLSADKRSKQNIWKPSKEFLITKSSMKDNFPKCLMPNNETISTVEESGPSTVVSQSSARVC